MESAATVTELDLAEVERVLAVVEEQLGEEIARPLRLLLVWSRTVLGLLERKNLSLKRLRRMLFGARTERTRDLVGEEPPKPWPGGETPPDSASSSEASSSEASSSETPSSETPATDEAARKRPRKGHGRIPASDYTGCRPVIVTHEAFSPGDPCTHCQDGTLYRSKDWVLKVRLFGQPPIGGTRYELERLRCGTCGKTHVAEPPQDMGPDKYDVSVASTLGVLHYGQGMPWNRIAQMQKFAGIPFPASDQWELCRDALDRGLAAVHQHLLWEAAQGDLLHHDDTRMQVLQWTAQVKLGIPLREDDPERTGVFTTSILSMAAHRPTIALFFTGAYHAGENLRRVLEQRREGLEWPMQMCDPLSCNMPKDLQTILANCLSHGRRKFADLADTFPDPVRYVLHRLKQVYRTDAAAKRFKLSDEQRLQLHQRRSGPVMEELHQWLTEQIDQRKVEPNSSLGEAIRYLLKHWEPLTLFLRRPGAPLDNNLCEQALKMAIRHRKNSLFYKTQRGADVGDIYMTLIHTCYFAGADPFDYLTQVQRHEQQVKAEPARWLPWNYREQLVEH
jgi:transposase